MPLDPYTARLFQIESGGNPNAVTGSNMGLGQFGPAERAQYGITDPTNPDQQATAVAREAAVHGGVLSKALGRDPTPGELYLTHQQGIAGGPALLTADPSIPAWQAIRPYYKSDRIAQQAITGNIPKGSPLAGKDASQITAGDFAGYWKDKFEGRIGAASTAPNPFSAQAVPTQAPMGISMFPQVAANTPGAAPPPVAAQQGNADLGPSLWHMLAPPPAPAMEPMMPITPPRQVAPDLRNLYALLQANGRI